MKTTRIVSHLGQYKKIEALERKLASLQNPPPTCTVEEVPDQDVLPEELYAIDVDKRDSELDLDTDIPMDTDPAPDASPITLPVVFPRKSRSFLPNNDAHKLSDQWKKVLPQLVESLLFYISTTLGKKWITVTNVASQCRQPSSCTIRKKEVLCLFLCRA
jgi:hypothetical protein